MSDKAYLGDSVYVEIEGGVLRLTTENGREASNTIFMEESVWRELHNYVERIKKANEPNPNLP